MRATAKLKDLKMPGCKNTIVRNLSRILDIRILDIDVENNTVSFVYDSVFACEKAKKELGRIGYPVQECTYQKPKKSPHILEYKESTVTL